MKALVKLTYKGGGCRLAVFSLKEYNIKDFQLLRTFYKSVDIIRYF